MRRAAGTALLGLVLALTAAAFGAQGLYVPGIGLLALGAGAVAWVWAAAARAGIARAPLPDQVVEGDPLEVTIEIRSGPAGLPGGEVVDPALGAPVALRPTGEALRRLRGTVRFARRGPRHIGPPELALADPLDLATRRVGGGRADELLVLPRVEPVRATGGGGLARAGIGRAQRLEEIIEVDGLRPYRDGAPASRIHWPAVARGHGLVERRLRAESEERPLVVLDSAGDPREEALDAAVRAAASLSHELARAGGCDLLLPGDRRALTLDADLAGWPAAHARLAMVAPAARGPWLRGGVRRGALIYVAARPLERLPAAAAAVAAGPALLVFPGGTPAGRIVLEVAGCRGYAAGRDARRRTPGEEAAA